MAESGNIRITAQINEKLNAWNNWITESIMKIKIFYCVIWNYEPRGSGLAVELKKAIGLDSELASGKSGDFEVTVDGKRVFSKHKLSRFPEPGEDLKMLKKWLLRKEDTHLEKHNCLTSKAVAKSLSVFYSVDLME